MKAKAAIMEEHDKPFILDYVDVDDPKENEVMVKIVGSGVCGSDVHFRRPQSLTLPAVLGHEGSGYVCKVGKNVKNVKEGDRVMIAGTFCGECERCLTGESYLCTYNVHPLGMQQDNTYRAHWNGKDISAMFSQGTFKEYTVVHKNALTIVPDSVELSSVGPVGCGVKTGAGAVMNTLKCEANSTLLVYGAGPVGLSAVMAAKVAACKEIICVDVKENRLQSAKEYGATHVIDASKCDDVAAAIKEIVPGGLDYTLDAAGVTPLIELQLSLLKRGGTAALVAVPSNPANNLLSPAILSSAITIKAHFGSGAHTPTFLKKLLDYNARGIMPFDTMNKYYAFEDIEKAFEDMQAGIVLKPVVTFD